MTPRLRYTLVGLALATLAAGCPDRAPPATAVPYPPPPPGPAPSPAPTPQPPPGPPPGACRNESVNTTCTFTTLSRVDPDDAGRPVAPEAPADADGTVTFAAGYRFGDGVGPTGLAAVWVRATPADRPALERFFAEHREARCGGEILYAPCPPGVHVIVNVPAPPVGSVVPSQR